MYCIVLMDSLIINLKFNTFSLYIAIFFCLQIIHFLSFFTSLFSSVRSVMYKYLEKENEISFDKIFNQILGKYCSLAIVLVVDNVAFVLSGVK